MNYREELFLSQFDSSYRTQVIEFSKNLTKLSEEYEVIIFMARKAACLADCFAELKMTNFHCTITSSRVLDMSLNWLKGKKIAIVDDALITGTTIYSAIEKLSKKDICDVKVHVLSIDNNWWSNELVNPNSSYLSLNSKQTSLICSNIVKAISTLPRPYNIDYPLFKKIKIHNNDFGEIFGSSNWSVHDSSSQFQIKNNIVNLTIAPSDSKLFDFSTHLGLDFLNNSLVKLRLYAFKINDLFWCQLLPIVILPPITKIDLEKLFNRICESNNERFHSYFDSEDENDSLKSKLRLVQYYFGCRISEIWHAEFISKTNKKVILKQDFRNIHFLFSPDICAEIEDISYKNEVSFSDLDIKVEQNIEKVIANKNETFNELKAFHMLTKPFIELYKNKELSARSLVKKHGIKAFKLPEYKKTIDRLNQGYSIGDLKECIKNIPSYINKNKLISLFLDIYIDRGSVVPITFINNNLIYRAYRHGEDVEFSESEIRLCMAMLHSFAKGYGSIEIFHTIVEKLLVLFVRVGIEKDILNLVTNPRSEYPSMGIRFYLHGAIVSEAYTKSVFRTDFKNSLTNVLIETGYLTKNTPKSPYILNECSENGVDIKSLGIAKQLGTVLGELLNPNNSHLNYDELILMSTCPYKIDLLGAVAAEDKIFQDFYAYQKDRFFGNFKSNNLSNFETMKKHTVKEAMNSGTWKYRSYEKGKPWDAINRATELLDNDLYKEVWKSFWPYTGNETSKSNVDEKVVDLTKKIAGSLFLKRFYINLVNVSLIDTFKKFEKSKVNKDLKKIITEIEESFPELHSNIFKTYNQLNQKFKSQKLNKEGLYNFSTIKLDTLYQKSRQLLSEVDILTSNHGKIDKTYHYNNTCVIDFKKYNVSKKKVKKIFDKVLNQTRIQAKKGNSTLIMEIPSESTLIKTGYWICAEGLNSKKWLLYFANKLTNELESISTIKLTFFFDLGDFRILRKVNTNQFYAPLFWEVAKQLLKRKFKLNPGNEVIYFSLNKSDELNIESIAKRELQGFVAHKKGKKEIDIYKPYQLKFKSNHFIKTTKQQIKNIMDVGVITIVPEELVAVTDYFKSTKSYKSAKGTQSGRTYYYGKMKDRDGEDLNVVAAQASEQGNRSVISIYNALIQEFNPDLIILLGIAGSLHEDVKICDVAIADSIYYYDKRAETTSGIKRRLDPFKLNLWSKELIRNFHHEVKSEEPNFSSSPNSPKPDFTSFYGPIGSGEAVIKFKESEVRKWLQTLNDKTLAVETEAGGFAQQFYEDELNYSKRAKGILIIRGISDKADVNKKDEWRLASAKNAVKVLSEILKANKL